MGRLEPSFTVGIEEEYLLVDVATRALADDPPAELFAECEARLHDLVKPEFLKSQLEVSTAVCATVGDAGRDLANLRRVVVEVARRHGLAPIAASTHPFSEWQHQHHTDRERYNMLAENMQAVARRLLICGMHVHVGINDDELRIDLMNQVSYFLPHLLALSTSSPFWRGEDTGLRSYRLAVFDELPRTGLPEIFDSWAEYQRHIRILVDAGLLADASMMWWDIRPSSRFPTLEMRITDVCPLIEDAVTIAAAYVCIIRMLYRLRRSNQRWRKYANMLIQENRWRAQRYGCEGTLVDFGRAALVPYGELAEELIDMLAEDADALDCGAELRRIRDIARDGTSANRQIACHRAALAAGATREDALKAVVDQLIAETASGI